MSWTLGELAAWVGGRVQGDPSRRILGIAPLHEAGPQELSFLVDVRYLEAARSTRAGAVLCRLDTPSLSADRLEVEHPREVLARLLEKFYPEPPPPVGIHPTAVVDPSCSLGTDVWVGPYAVLGAGVVLGNRVKIGAHVVLGDECRVGDDSAIHPHAVLYRRTVIGQRSVVHAGCVLGAPGFGYLELAEGGWRQIPQTGSVELGDDVEIGAASAVDRALVGRTRVESGTKIDNLVQVGHNVQIGPGSLLCGQAGVAGSSILGKGVVLGGQAGVSGHLVLGDRVRVAAKSAVFEDVPAGTDVAGIPARPLREWRRQQAVLGRFRDLWRLLQGETRVQKKRGE